IFFIIFFFFQAEDGIRDPLVTGVQTCALPISARAARCRPGHRRDDLDTLGVAPSRRGRAAGPRSSRDRRYRRRRGRAARRAPAGPRARRIASPPGDSRPARRRTPAWVLASRPPSAVPAGAPAPLPR